MVTVYCDGTIAGLQAAVNQVAQSGAGTIFINAGAFPFNPPMNGIGVTIPWGTNDLEIIGAGDQTILENTVNAGSSVMIGTAPFTGNPTQMANISVSNMTLKGFVQTEALTNNTGIAINHTKDWRVHHVKLLDFCGSSIRTTDSTGGTYDFFNTGLVDHCFFDNPYKLTITPNEWGYGVAIYGKDLSGTDYWENLADVLGQFDTVKNTIVYVEDCEFHRCRHATASNNGSWYVARHNYIDWTIPLNYQALDIHGPAYGMGGRGCELYDNITVGALWRDPPPLYAAYGVALRGGASFVYNNTFQDGQAGVRLLYESNIAWRVVRDTYIWNNTCLNTPLPIRNEFPADIIENPLTKPSTGGWCYTRPPTFAEDGFAYTPYPYPHPMTLESQGTLVVNSTIPNAKFSLERL